jgi:tetratricopeptide (TPR) repeat protein
MAQVAEYKDFDLVVTAEDGKYFAQVLDSPAGQSARCKIDLPFDQNQILQILYRLEIAILRSVRPVRSSRIEADLRQIGDQLFRSLLLQSDEIRLLYSGSRQGLGSDARLRLKLRIDADPLSSLPWEYFYDDLVLKDYVGLDAQTSLVRYMHLAQPVQKLAIQGPLRILGMVANPRNGDDLAKLDVTDERSRIDKAIHVLHERGEVDFQWVPGESHNDLFDAMYKGPWHVFHFIGHGGVDSNTGEGFLVLAGETGEPEEFSAAKLTRVLRMEKSLRLVVLNCCDSARGNSSLAKSLVSSGIPAVLAMQFPISDEAAIELASAFYVALANGEPVDGAVTHARIKMQHKSNIEWGIPVLYMRAPDGCIFEKQLPQTPPSPPPAPAITVPPPAPVALLHAETMSSVAMPGDNTSSRLDSGVFSDLERIAEERAVDANAAFLAEINLETLSQEQLLVLVETGKRLTTLDSADVRLRRRLAKIYYQLGSRYQNENSLNKAFVNISAAIDLDPVRPEFLYARANIFARGDRFDAATADLDQAIKLAPTRGELHWAKGVICLLASRTAVHQDQLKVAIDAFSAAVKCDPNAAKYYSSRGAAYSRLGQSTEAMADLETALKLDPSDGKTYFNRGHLRLRQQNEAGATEDFRRAVELGYALANTDLQRLLGEGGTRH